MTHPYNAFDDRPAEADSILCEMQGWEVALNTVSRLAVVFALTLALILVLAHQMGRPL